ncbi:MAG: hypothetical protein QM621_11220 [Aeromicrobium sp.]|uniref:hypothetical protein n=1 Tax=Aeromicrobium sp. TaxID=1871063 RepID=UPI0039E5E147
MDTARERAADNARRAERGEPKIPGKVLRAVEKRTQSELRQHAAWKIWGQRRQAAVDARAVFTDPEPFSALILKARLRRALDAPDATSWEGFVEAAETEGVTVVTDPRGVGFKQHRRNLTTAEDEKTRLRRPRSLGADFEKASLDARIAENAERAPHVPAPAPTRPVILDRAGRPSHFEMAMAGYSRDEINAIMNAEQMENHNTLTTQPDGPPEIHTHESTSSRERETAVTPSPGSHDVSDVEPHENNTSDDADTHMIHTPASHDTSTHETHNNPTPRVDDARENHVHTNAPTREDETRYTSSSGSQFVSDAEPRGKPTPDQQSARAIKALDEKIRAQGARAVAGHRDRQR